MEGPGQGVLTEAGRGMDMEDVGGCCSVDIELATEEGTVEGDKTGELPGMKGWGGKGG